ncbi:hypothetical protein KI387_032539, partial [Taxus chinensis]
MMRNLKQRRIIATAITSSPRLMSVQTSSASKPLQFSNNCSSMSSGMVLWKALLFLKNRNTTVVEISSSDDEGETETQARRSSSFKRPLFSDNDDEITVIDSFPCYEKKNIRPKRAKSFGTQIQDWENECLVLEGDPEKVIADPGVSADESEDLVVTAEKGQVACRDFPHPRHLCVKFPFKNTPHEKYCDK